MKPGGWALFVHYLFAALMALCGAVQLVTIPQTDGMAMAFVQFTGAGFCAYLLVEVGSSIRRLHRYRKEFDRDR